MFLSHSFARKNEITQTEDKFEMNNRITCHSCGKVIANIDYRYLSCNHTFCIECLMKFIFSQFDDETETIYCPICVTPISTEEIETLDPDVSRTLLDKASIRAISNFGTRTQCPRCKMAFMFEPGLKSEILNDADGTPMRPEALECIRLNRCSCIKCTISFCVNCGATPFHEGYTCEEQKLIDDGIVCRFCGKPIFDGDKLPPQFRVCSKKECLELMNESCEYVHPECGHPCCGVIDEDNHFPCAICNYAICSYCAEELTTKPSIMLKCGHYCHLECVKNTFNVSSDEKKIKLPKCGGLGCYEIPCHPLIMKEYNKWKPLADAIEKIRKSQMDKEDLKNDPRVLNEEDQDYYQKPYDLARSIFVFYKCQKCKNPYYGGHVECGGEEMPEDQIYLCDKCGIIGSESCKIHGTNGMIFKCFYCCRQATFFCFGTTHFCTECHNRWQAAMKGPWPVCNGKCQFAPHNSNGTKKIFGYCAVCQSIRNRKGKG